MYSALTQMQNTIGVGFVKISICLFLLRLIEGTHQRTRYILWGVITVIAVLHSGTIFTLAAQCRPYQKIWEPTLEGQVCANAIGQ